MTKQERIDKAVEALRALRNKISYGCDYGEEPSQVTVEEAWPNRSVVRFDVRYWGSWENPEDAEDEEDYDWQVLSPASREKLNEIVKSYSATYSVDIQAQCEEKCWITFRVIIKEE